MDVFRGTNIAAFIEHSGAVALVIAFLMVAIGVTLLMSTAGRPGEAERSGRSER